jgi:hypothetical protein
VIELKLVHTAAFNIGWRKGEAVARQFNSTLDREMKKIGLQAFAICVASDWVWAVMTHNTPTSRGGGASLGTGLPETAFHP